MNNNSMLDGLLIDFATTRDEELSRVEATKRLAATTVRNLCLRHDRRCRDGCSHRNHRRDHANLADGLEILDLAADVARADDYDSRLEWASMSRSEAVVMSGRSYSNAS
jgi:hypothetical protein